VRSPERLSFTWTWEKDPTVMHGSEGTLVALELRQEAGGTELTLTHSGFSGKLVRRLHEEGWNALLGSLAEALS
jgi:uncharacterized protein YndB with AHSA1/START domain